MLVATETRQEKGRLLNISIYIEPIEAFLSMIQENQRINNLRNYFITQLAIYQPVLLKI